MTITKYSGTSGVALPLAVWLASDFYDHSTDQNTLSVTTLIKPIRQVILASRVPAEDYLVDLSSMVASRIGTAIHDSIERSWAANHVSAMGALGIPRKVIDSVRVNPSKETLENTEGVIPVYLEQRLKRQVGKYTISGKFDVVLDGKVQDFKSTQVFGYMRQLNASKYSQQGSIYRWLDSELITQDVMDVHYIFTDWKPAMLASDPKYPRSRVLTQTIELMSLQETDRYVTRKLSQIEAYWEAPEEDLPLCSDEDLWRSEPVFKYYKNPEKTARSTKNFDTKQEAMLRYIEDGSKGIVKEVPGQVTACKYCAAFSVCSQKDRLIKSGDLLMN